MNYFPSVPQGLPGPGTTVPVNTAPGLTANSTPQVQVAEHRM